MKSEFIRKALDTTNAFLSSNSYAQAVNPNIWDRQLRDFEEKNLVVAKLAQVYDFRQPGVDLKTTVDAEPSAAATLVETTDITITPITNRQVTWTPTEKGAAFQTSRTEMVRSFFNVMENATKKLGYMLAKKKDAVCVAAVLAGAGNSYNVNGASALTDIASTDTINLASVTEGNKLIFEDQYTPKKLVVSFKQGQDLLDLAAIRSAEQFGTRKAIANGLIGMLYGLEVVVSHSIAVETTAVKSVNRAMILGESGSGEQAYGIAVKRDPIIETEYHALGRRWDIVGHEDYDVQVLHPNAICLIGSYYSG